jgi:hypothetical protein
MSDQSRPSFNKSPGARKVVPGRVVGGAQQSPREPIEVSRETTVTSQRLGRSNIPLWLVVAGFLLVIATLTGDGDVANYVVLFTGVGLMVVAGLLEFIDRRMTAREYIRLKR